MVKEENTNFTPEMITHLAKQLSQVFVHEHVVDVRLGFPLFAFPLPYIEANI